MSDKAPNNARTARRGQTTCELELKLTLEHERNVSRNLLYRCAMNRNTVQLHAATKHEVKHLKDMNEVHIQQLSEYREHLIARDKEIQDLRNILTVGSGQYGDVCRRLQSAHEDIDQLRQVQSDYQSCLEAIGNEASEATQRADTLENYRKVRPTCSSCLGLCA
jgi:septation ring formation regulator EzrA